MTLRGEAFGAQLVAARKAVGLSQVELARKVGVAQSTLSKWESGESDLQAMHLRPLAKALCVSLEVVTPGGLVIADTNSEDRIGLLLVQRVSKAVAERRLRAGRARLILELLQELEN